MPAMATRKDCGRRYSVVPFLSEERVKGSQRVIHGGSWNNNLHHVCASNRNRNRPDNCNNNQEFRLAQSARANF